MIEARAPRRIWPLLTAAGVALYLVSLVFTAPASVLAFGLARATANTAMLERAEGGLWSGRAAALVITPPATAPQRFAEVTWSVSRLRLLRAQLAVEVTANGGTKGKATLFVQPGSVRFSDVTLSMPVSTVVPFVPALNLARPGGEFQVRARELDVSRSAIGGEAQGEWIDASSVLSAVVPLGRYRAVLKGSGASAQLEVTTVSGPLQIAGKGMWYAAEGVRFTGLARSDAAQAGALKPLLDLLGPDDGRGGHALRYVGKP